MPITSPFFLLRPFALRSVAATTFLAVLTAAAEVEGALSRSFMAGPVSVSAAPFGDAALAGRSRTRQELPTNKVGTTMSTMPDIRTTSLLPGNFNNAETTTAIPTLRGNAAAVPRIDDAASSSMFPKLKMNPAAIKNTCAKWPATNMRSVKPRSDPKEPNVNAAITDSAAAPIAKSMQKSSKRQRGPASLKVLTQDPKQINERTRSKSAEI